jgi:hypothetical protein
MSFVCQPPKNAKPVRTYLGLKKTLIHDCSSQQASISFVSFLARVVTMSVYRLTHASSVRPSLAQEKDEIAHGCTKKNARRVEAKPPIPTQQEKPIQYFSSTRPRVQHERQSPFSLALYP